MWSIFGCRIVGRHLVHGSFCWLWSWELGFGVYGGGGRWFSFGFPDYLVKVFLDFSSSSSFSNSFYPIFWVSFLLIEQIQIEEVHGVSVAILPNDLIPNQALIR